MWSLVWRARGPNLPSGNASSNVTIFSTSVDMPLRAESHFACDDGDVDSIESGGLVLGPIGDLV